MSLNRNITVSQGDVALSPTAPATGGTVSRVPLQGNAALSPTAPTVARTANVAIVPPQGNVALSPTAPNTVLNFRITVAQGNIFLSGSSPQTTPGLHPLSGNLMLSSAVPIIEIGHTHHWRRIVSLRGGIDQNRAGSGSVDQKSNLKGTIKQDPTIGAS
jgi:hypothetical protein